MITVIEVLLYVMSWSVLILAVEVVRGRRRLHDMSVYAEDWKWKAQQENRWRHFAERQRNALEKLVVQIRADGAWSTRGRGNGPN